MESAVIQTMATRFKRELTSYITAVSNTLRRSIGMFPWWVLVLVAVPGRGEGGAPSRSEVSDVVRPRPL